MTRIWSRPSGVADRTGLNYWDYFAARLVEEALIYPGAILLDVGCGTGSSLFPAVEKAGRAGYGIGIDICTG
jgi:O-methyltransferase/aklanonic acid methyltransferase